MDIVRYLAAASCVWSACLLLREWENEELLHIMYALPPPAHVQVKACSD